VESPSGELYEEDLGTGEEDVDRFPFMLFLVFFAFLVFLVEPYPYPYAYPYPSHPSIHPLIAFELQNPEKTQMLNFIQFIASSYRKP